MDSNFLKGRRARYAVPVFAAAITMLVFRTGMAEPPVQDMQTVEETEQTGTEEETAPMPVKAGPAEEGPAGKTVKVLETAEAAEPEAENADGAETEDTSAGSEEAGWVNTERGYRYRSESGIFMRNAWVLDNEKMYYIKDDGIMAADGFFSLNDGTYCFGESGDPITGKFSRDDAEYYAGDTGKLYSSEWVSDPDGTWYYILEDGKILKNGLTPDNYYMDGNGHIQFGPDADVISFGAAGLSLKVKTAAAIWDYLKKDGWTDTAIAGVLGNWEMECGMNPNAQESRGSGYGLGQWSGGRRRAYEKWASANGYDKADIYTQLQYMLIEPEESDYVHVYKTVEYGSPAEAARKWMVNWERPRSSASMLNEVRIPYANAYYAYFSGREVPAGENVEVPKAAVPETAQEQSDSSEASEEEDGSEESGQAETIKTGKGIAIEPAGSAVQEEQESESQASTEETPAEEVQETDAEETKAQDTAQAEEETEYVPEDGSDGDGAYERRSMEFGPAFDASAETETQMKEERGPGFGMSTETQSSGANGSAGPGLS